MTKNTLIKGLIGATVIATLALPMFAMAQGTVNTNELLPSGIGTALGTGTGDIRITIATIIRTAMSFLGIIAVLIILYGGFKWMTAGGGEEQVGEAKKIITSGIIGLIIILMAYGIASFVISNLISATK